MSQVPPHMRRFKTPPDAIDDFRTFGASMYAEARKLPGYPFVRCPICGGDWVAATCNHILPERAKAVHPIF